MSSATLPHPMTAEAPPPAPATTAVPRRRLPWLCTAAGLALAITTRQFADPDVWWHVAVGRVITDHGIPTSEPFSFAGAPNPWIGQQWLYEAALARMVSASGAGLAMAVMGGVAALAFLLAALATRRDDDIPGPVLAASLLACCLVSGEVLGVRGQVVTILGTAAVLLVVTRWRDGSARAVWALPPILLVWANLHAGFAAGLVIPVIAAATVAAHRRLGGDEPAHVRPLVLATLVAGAATVVNPAGPQLWGYVVSTFSNPTLTGQIIEWQSPDFHSFWPRATELLVLAIVVLWATGHGRPDPLDVVLLLGAVAATLQAQRNVSLLAVVATPQLARYGMAGWRRYLAARPTVVAVPPRRRRPPPPPAFTWAIAAIAVTGTLVTVVLPLASSSSTARYERTNEPAAAVGWVAANRPGARLYSLYEWGGYIAGRLAPERVVWIYGESAVFGDQRLRDYLTVHDLEEGWRDTLARNGMHDAILPVAERETVAMLEVGWTPLCYDGASESVVLEEGPVPPRATAPPNPRSAPAC